MVDGAPPEPPPEPLSVRLTVADEDGTVVDERTVSLPVTFGRDPERVDVAVRDRMVSRLHARLEADGGTVVIVDLDSGNGTWVGDDEVQRRALAPADVITLGSSTVSWAPVTREPELGSAWCVVVGPDGLRALPLAEWHAGWVRSAAVADALAGADHRSALAGIDALLDDDLARVGAWTIAACTPDVDPRGFATAVARLRALPAHRRARDAGAEGDPELRAEDQRALARLAATLRSGAAVFGRHGGATATAGAGELLAAIRSVLTIATEWDQRLADHPSTRAS